MILKKFMLYDLPVLSFVYSHETAKKKDNTNNNWHTEFHQKANLNVSHRCVKKRQTIQNLTYNEKEYTRIYTKNENVVP